MVWKVKYRRTTGEIFLGENVYSSYAMATDAFLELKKLFTSYHGVEYDHVPKSYFPIGVEETDK